MYTRVILLKGFFFLYYLFHVHAHICINQYTFSGRENCNGNTLAATIFPSHNVGWVEKLFPLLQ